MHTPRCVPVRAVLDTIVLPRRGGQVAIPSGTGVSAGLAVPVGFGLVVSFPCETTIELTIAGASSHVLTLEPGTRRIVSPEDHPDVLVSAADAGRVWLEDLRALSEVSR